MPHVTGPVLSPAVAAAIRAGAPVVALESTLLAHGLPAPRNREVADELESAVRDRGAVPATVAVLDGVPRVGLTPAELDRVCGGGLVKLSVRDLGAAVGLHRDGATTVGATAALAAAAGIALFATGGLGGVHRGARETWDVSADLGALARTPVLTVCSGVKSILDVPATLELLETLSVPVLGYGTDAFPGFYRRDSGCGVPWRVDDPAHVAAVWRAHRDLGGGAGMMLARTKLNAASNMMGFEAIGSAYAPAVAVGAEVALTLKPGRLVIGLRYLWSELGRTSRGDEITGNSAGLIGDIGYRMTF